MLRNALQHETADHVPVLAGEVRELLAVEPGETVVDATFGAGGHAELLAADLGGRGRFIAIDRDASVRPYFERFQRHAGVQARLLRGDFAVVLGQLADNDVQADAILLDLGVSSMQIDRPERGFSYAADAPLDMRMDTSSPRTAADVVNELSERELADVFRRYGEERFSRQIARAIVRRRSEQPFERTADLVEVVRAAIPAPRRFGDGHPAKRVFQALRIVVNDELAALEQALPTALRLLGPGGRLAVISFHSLEDRIVKRFFAAQARGCTCPPDLPICVCGKEPAVPPCHPQGRPALPLRDRREPAGVVRAPPGGGEGVAGHMATAAARAEPRRTPRPKPRPEPRQAQRRRPAARPRVAGSVVWIVIVATLLAGIVALNVAVLRLNMTSEELDIERAELIAKRDGLEAELSRAAAAGRIEAMAVNRYGLTEPVETVYVRLTRVKE